MAAECAWAPWLEVVLAGLAATPVAARPLWSQGPPGVQGRAKLDDLLARLPRSLLRRGWGALDRHEVLLALLDPRYGRGTAQDDGAPGGARPTQGKPALARGRG